MGSVQWTDPRKNGQVERMIRIIEGTVKRSPSASHGQLSPLSRTSSCVGGLAPRIEPCPLLTCNFARRLKTTLPSLTPYGHLVKYWASEPDRLIANPTHRMPKPNTRL